jgi:hypothetical protein
MADPVNMIDPLGLCGQKNLFNSFWNGSTQIVGDFNRFVNNNPQEILGIIYSVTEIALGKFIAGTGMKVGAMIIVGSGGTLTVAGGAVAVSSAVAGEAMAAHGVVMIGYYAAKITVNEQQRGQKPVEVKVSKSKYPESYRHIEEAVENGKPDTLTINRQGAKGNRQEALKGLKKTSGKDLDEYPPAMFKEGGKGASVKPINPSDNRGAGSSMGHQLKTYPDGTKVKIIIGE